jgi:glycosyltransferase involved in cell wall biosynthesis
VVKVSFVMPAKNEERYIDEAIRSLQQAPYREWELIVVDDGSTDTTREVVSRIADRDGRINLLRNPGTGKVAAINAGYARTRGGLIKFIDADDVLKPEFFTRVDEMARCRVTCHDQTIVDERLRTLARYPVNGRFLRATYSQALSGLISIPRASWTFSRDAAAKILPLPTDLPFEDVWFSLMAKKHFPSLSHIGESLYLYRQNEGQTYGGILNFQRERIEFRARRMLRLIDVLVRQRLEPDIESILAPARTYYRILGGEERGLGTTLRAKVARGEKTKLLMLRYAPYLGAVATRLKWALQRGIVSGRESTGRHRGRQERGAG